MDKIVENPVNCLFGQLKGKHSNFILRLKSYEWMLEELDERVKRFSRFSANTFVVTKESDKGVDFINLNEQYTFPPQLGLSVLRKSERILKNFLIEVDGFYSNNVNYQDANSSYFRENHWEELNQRELLEGSLDK